MAQVKIDSGPIDPELQARHYPKEKWGALVKERRYFIEREITRDCRCLGLFIREAEQLYDSCGFESAEELIEKGYGLEPEEIQIAVRWLELNSPEHAVPIRKILPYFKLPKHGGDRRSEEREQGSNTTLEIGRGASYALARLNRDNPELAEKIKAGELSANAAAIQAGFRKRTISIPEDPQRAAASVIRNFGTDFAKEMARCLASDP